MNTEQIRQIIETIKTLNINLNDTTTQKIADAILPVVKMYLIKEYVSLGLQFIIGVGILVLIYKVAKLGLEYRNKKRNVD